MLPSAPFRPTIAFHTLLGDDDVLDKEPAFTAAFTADKVFSAGMVVLDGSPDHYSLAKFLTDLKDAA